MLTSCCILLHDGCMRETINNSPANISTNHWVLDPYTETMTRENWRAYLKNNESTIIFRGLLRQLRAKSIGGGMVVVSKDKKAL